MSLSASGTDASSRAATAGHGLRQRAEQLAATLPPLLVMVDHVAATVSQGVHGRRRVGGGETFWQFRRYQPGDAANQVDWRQSAKSQHLFIRETEWEAAESVWLWRDGSRSMAYQSPYATTEKKERATLLLLALAALLLRGGEHVGLLGEDTSARAGRVMLERFAATLLRHAGGAVADRQSIPPVARLPRFAELVLIGDFLSPLSEIDALIRGYAAADIKGHLLHVLDPAEEDLPFNGRTEFLGLEGEAPLIVSRVEGLRGDYATRLDAHRRGLMTVARTAGWTFTSHRTDRPPHTALLAVYEALASGSR